ncbi:MAG: hypothetical protein IID03_10375 [Candidatus Dadabacteria bacterium]|nr:hypothetical protein [Candidatus Dadabacteria bacterium]
MARKNRVLAPGWKYYLKGGDFRIFTCHVLDIRLCNFAIAEKEAEKKCPLGG